MTESGTIYDDWIANVEKKLGNLKEKIPSVIKRCPKCQSLNIEYDPKTHKLHCTKCGFEKFLQN